MCEEWDACELAELRLEHERDWRDFEGHALHEQSQITVDTIPVRKGNGQNMLCMHAGMAE